MLETPEENTPVLNTETNDDGYVEIVTDEKGKNSPPDTDNKQQLQKTKEDLQYEELVQKMKSEIIPRVSTCGLFARAAVGVGVGAAAVAIAATLYL